MTVVDFPSPSHWLADALIPIPTHGQDQVARPLGDGVGLLQGERRELGIGDHMIGEANAQGGVRIYEIAGNDISLARARPTGRGRSTRTGPG